MLFGIVIAPTESPFPPCVGSTMVDVSVVIATYNRASMLREAIDSVLAQTEPVREVIVVDDGSTDNTRDVLSGYGSRIVALYQPQSGASAARNRAIRAATGEWIAFLDDDDIWLDSKIERQMVIAKGNRNLGLVYCSDYAVDEKLQILWERAAAAENRGNVFDRLFVRNFIFTSCVIARRNAIEQVGYLAKDLRFAEDLDLWLRIAAAYPVDFVDEPLVLYRQSASGCLTRNIAGVDRLRDLEKVLARASTLREVPYGVRRRSRYEVERQWAAMWLREAKNCRAFRHALQVVGSQPVAADGYRLLANSLVPQTLRRWLKRIFAREPQQRIVPSGTPRDLKAGTPAQAPRPVSHTSAGPVRGCAGRPEHRERSDN